MQLECCDFIASGDTSIAPRCGFVALSVHLEPSVTALSGQNCIAKPENTPSSRGILKGSDSMAGFSTLPHRGFGHALTTNLTTWRLDALGPIYAEYRR